MEVISMRKETQKEVYNKIKEVVEYHGFKKENSSMITLLLQPGATDREEQLLKKVHRLLAPLNRTYAAVVEPVVGEPEIYELAEYYYHEHKPWFHVHILIQEEGKELRSLSSEWFKIIGKSTKRLFHCSHIKDSIASTVNYMTKYFEAKRDGNPCYHIYQVEQIDKYEEPTNDLVEAKEPVTVGTEPKVYKWFPWLKKKHAMKVLTISWICVSVFLSTIRKLE